MRPLLLRYEERCVQFRELSELAAKLLHSKCRGWTERRRRYGLMEIKDDYKMP